MISRTQAEAFDRAIEEQIAQLTTERDEAQNALGAALGRVRDLTERLEFHAGRAELAESEAAALREAAQAVVDYPVVDIGFDELRKALAQPGAGAAYLERLRAMEEANKTLYVVIDAGIDNMGRKCFCCGAVGDWGQKHRKDCPLPAALATRNIEAGAED